MYRSTCFPSKQQQQVQFVARTYMNVMTFTSVPSPWVVPSTTWVTSWIPGNLAHLTCVSFPHQVLSIFLLCILHLLSSLIYMLTQDGELKTGIMGEKGFFLFVFYFANLGNTGLNKLNTVIYPKTYWALNMFNVVLTLHVTFWKFIWQLNAWGTIWTLNYFSRNKRTALVWKVYENGESSSLI